MCNRLPTLQPDRRSRRLRHLLLRRRRRRLQPLEPLSCPLLHAIQHNQRHQTTNSQHHPGIDCQALMHGRHCVRKEHGVGRRQAAGAGQATGRRDCRGEVQGEAGEAAQSKRQEMQLQVQLCDGRKSTELTVLLRQTGTVLSAVPQCQVWPACACRSAGRCAATVLPAAAALHSSKKRAGASGSYRWP